MERYVASASNQSTVCTSRIKLVLLSLQERKLEDIIDVVFHPFQSKLSVITDPHLLDEVSNIPKTFPYDVQEILQAYLSEI